MEAFETNNQLKSVLIRTGEPNFGAILKEVIRGVLKSPFVVQTERLSECRDYLRVCHFDLFILTIDSAEALISPELIFSLKRDFQKTKVLVVSTVDHVEPRHYLSAGVDHFIQKKRDVHVDLTQAIDLLFG